MVQTLKFLISGLLGALVLNIPVYSWVFVKQWGFAQGFPLGWLGNGLLYMGTFFHEIGHTVAAWFYGFPTLPMFDFQHGGGMAVWHNGGYDLIVILAAVYAAMACGMYYFRDVPLIRNSLIVLFILNIATVWSETIKFNIIDFMGPAAECLIGGFLVFRAVFNLAPRGALERFLNALIGFGMLIAVFIESWALLDNGVYRAVYYQQKGREGWGDFDKIARRTEWISFDGVIGLWGGLGFFCLLLPFVLFAINSQKELDNHKM
ncbi:hypothetical protein N9Z27_01145 [Alphaproteobacteria bacterium]|nr:hypothetical protein [Alphaproteobacteria bacterium]